ASRQKSGLLALPDRTEQLEYTLPRGGKKQLAAVRRKLRIELLLGAVQVQQRLGGVKGNAHVCTGSDEEVHVGLLPPIRGEDQRQAIVRQGEAFLARVRVDSGDFHRSCKILATIVASGDPEVRGFVRRLAARYEE